MAKQRKEQDGDRFARTHRGHVVLVGICRDLEARLPFLITGQPKKKQRETGEQEQTVPHSQIEIPQACPCTKRDKNEDWQILVALIETYRVLHRISRESGQPLWHA